MKFSNVTQLSLKFFLNVHVMLSTFLKVFYCTLQKTKEDSCGIFFKQIILQFCTNYHVHRFFLVTDQLKHILTLPYN